MLFSQSSAVAVPPSRCTACLRTEPLLRPTLLAGAAREARSERRSRTEAVKFEHRNVGAERLIKTRPHQLYTIHKPRPPGAPCAAGAVCGHRRGGALECSAVGDFCTSTLPVATSSSSSYSC